VPEAAAAEQDRSFGDKGMGADGIAEDRDR
jgi:hypothetical protein